MELETLKKLWQEGDGPPFNTQTREKNHLESLMKNKSQSTFAKLKRSMRLKSATAGFLGIFALSVSVMQLLSIFNEPMVDFSFLSASEMGMIMALMGMVLLTVAAFNFTGYRRIARFERSARSLKAMLEESAGVLRRVMAIGVYSDAIFVPLIAGFVAYTWLFQRQGFVWDIRLAYLVLIVSGTALFSYFTANRLMRSKHGTHLSKILDYLKELNTSNGEQPA